MLAMAAWIAPAATMIAAIMTAANLGSRVTGWGFAVFTLGAAAWMAVGFATGQQNLLVSNAFLFFVDAVGVWRWLGRRARYDAGARRAAETSEASAGPALFAIGAVAGQSVLDASGRTIGTVVDAMAACRTGAIRYLVVREGGVAGIGERLHALDWSECRIDDAGIRTDLARGALADREALDPARWPARSEAVDDR